MSAANKKFQQLNRQVHAWKARDYQEDNKLRTDKFPHCRGTFDTCPQEEEFNSLLKENKAAAICGRCPVFQGSKASKIVVSDRNLTVEDEELRKMVFGK